MKINTITRLSLTGICLATGILGSCAARAGTMAPGMIININPGFEDGTRGWLLRKGENTGFTLVPDAKTGARALRITGRTRRYHGIGQFIDVLKLKNDSSFSLSIWIRLDARAMVMGTVMREDDNGKNWRNAFRRYVTDTGKWVLLQGGYDLNYTGTLRQLEIYLDVYSKDGLRFPSYNIDDFRFILTHAGTRHDLAGRRTMSGREMIGKIYRYSQRLAAMPVGKIRFRGSVASVSLNGTWPMLPVAFDNPENGKWTKIPVPSRRGYYWFYKNGEKSWRSHASSWYARAFKVPKQFTGRRVFIEFDAVVVGAEVYLNGKYVGTHWGQESFFDFDVTDKIMPGKTNILNVFVIGAANFLTPEGGLTRFAHNAVRKNFCWGGIVYPVRLAARGAVNVANVQVITSTRKAELSGVVELRNSTAIDRRITYRMDVIPWQAGAEDGNGESVLEVARGETKIQAGSMVPVSYRRAWRDPRVWDIDDPYLYCLRIRISKQGRVIEEYLQRFGFREFWIQGRDFYLNGKKIHLLGDSAWEEANPINNRRDYVQLRLRILKEMNCNCVRRHYGAGNHSFYDVADEMGMLMIAQMGGQISSRRSEYYRKGGKKLLQNIKLSFGNIIRNLRNHPSIIIWDVENEGLRGKYERNWSWMQHLDEYVLAHDRTRPIEHSGAGIMGGRAGIIHLHQEDSHQHILEGWQRLQPAKPAIVGEWWIGSRGGKTWLISGRDTHTYRDYRAEEGRLFREYIEMHRRFGASTMPYSILPRALRYIFFKTRAIEYPKGIDDDIRVDFMLSEGDNPRRKYGDYATGGRINPGYFPDLPAYRKMEPFFNQLKAGFSPVMVSFADSAGNFRSGEVLDKSMVVVNDMRKTVDLHLCWQLASGASAITSGSINLRIPPGEQARHRLRTELPKVSGLARYRLKAWVEMQDERLSKKEMEIRVFPPARKIATGMPFMVYDPGRRSAAMLEKSGAVVIPLESLAELVEKPGVLVIGRDAPYTELMGFSGKMIEFLGNGGSIVILKQSRYDQWLPVPLGFFDSARKTPVALLQMLPDTTTRLLQQRYYSRIERPGHALVKGLSAESLCFFRAGDGRVCDDTYRKPDGFCGNLSIVSSIVYFDGIVLAEIDYASGRIILCQYNLEENYGRDPAAKKLLNNILQYAAQGGRRELHAVHVLGNRTLAFLKDKVHAAAQQIIPGRNLAFGPMRTVIIGREADLTDLDRIAAGKFVDQGGTLLVLPRTRNFSVLGKTFKLTPGPRHFVLNAAGAVLHTGLLAGMNSFELTLAHKTLIQHCFVHDLPAGVRPLATAHWSYINERNGHCKCIIPGEKPAGWSVVEFTSGKGRVFLSQVPFLPEAGGTVYRTAQFLNNLGIRLIPQAFDKYMVDCLRAADMEIDGRFNDWTSDNRDRNVSLWRHAKPILLDRTTKFIDRGQTGLTDLSAIVYLMYDRNYFYLAAVVVDDHRFWPKSGSEAWKYDSIQFFLNYTDFCFFLDRNGRPVMQRGGRRLSRAQLQRCRLVMKPVERVDVTSDLRLLQADDKFKQAGGYVLEAAIPIDLLFTRQEVGVGKSFRFVIALNDNDDGKPARQGQKVYPRTWKWGRPDTFALGIFRE